MPSMVSSVPAIFVRSSEKRSSFFSFGQLQVYVIGCWNVDIGDNLVGEQGERSYYSTVKA